MKKAFSFALLAAVCLCHANAQDTVRWGDGSIYMVPPVVKDSFYYRSSTLWDWFFRMPTEHPNYFYGMTGYLFVAENNTLIYGIAMDVPTISVRLYPVAPVETGVPLYDGWENGGRDSALWAIVMRKRQEGGRVYYERLDSVIWHPHSASRIIEIQPHSPHFPDDTVKRHIPMYEFYFDHPLTVQDSFYVCLRPAYGWEVSPNVSRPYIGCDIQYNFILLSYGVPYGTGIAGYNGGRGDWMYEESLSRFGTMYPILVPPDTDDVPQCMAPANFRKSGQRMEYPILAWDTTDGGQREYEIQYAPWGSDQWITFEPTDNTATVFPASNPDI